MPLKSNPTLKGNKNYYIFNLLCIYMNEFTHRSISGRLLLKMEIIFPTFKQVQAKRDVRNEIHLLLSSISTISFFLINN